MLGLLLYEILELLYYGGKLTGRGIYAIYKMIYGSYVDQNNADDMTRLRELELRILELESKLDDSRNNNIANNENESSKSNELEK